MVYVLTGRYPIGDLCVVEFLVAFVALANVTAQFSCPHLKIKVIIGPLRRDSDNVR